MYNLGPAPHGSAFIFRAGPDLDPYSPKKLDPDRPKVNADPKH
jgi:hypothetical protein